MIDTRYFNRHRRLWNPDWICYECGGLPEIRVSSMEMFHWMLSHMEPIEDEV